MDKHKLTLLMLCTLLLYSFVLPHANHCQRTPLQVQLVAESLQVTKVAAVSAQQGSFATFHDTAESYG